MRGVLGGFRGGKWGIFWVQGCLTRVFRVQGFSGLGFIGVRDDRVYPVQAL